MIQTWNFIPSITSLNRAKKEKFKHKITGFRIADYTGYRDFLSTELFELLFDEKVWTLLVEQTILYAAFKGDLSFIVNGNEMKVFVVILIISGIVLVLPRHLF